MKDISEAKQIEEIKREYYSKNVNASIEKDFSFDTEE